jgi:hypothetical protein
MDMPRQRHFEPQSERNEPVVITRLDQTPEGGLIVEMAAGSMTVKLPNAIEAGTSVRVETRDMLVFGEVARCDAAGEGFRLGLILRNSLQQPPAIEPIVRPI